MNTYQFEALVVAAPGISRNEFRNLFGYRKKKANGLIPTPLTLVYRRGNELSVKNGLDLSRKDELWGMRLPSGLMIGLYVHRGAETYGDAWKVSSMIAKSMRYRGKQGRLPSDCFLFENFGCEETELLAATIDCLAALGCIDIEEAGLESTILSCSRIEKGIVACTLGISSVNAELYDRDAILTMERTALFD